MSQSLEVFHEGFTHSSDTAEEYFVSSSLPIVMSAYNNNAGSSEFDIMYVPPVSTQNVIAKDLDGIVVETVAGQTVEENNTGTGLGTYYFSDTPFSVQHTADGAGNDCEHGMPIEMLGDTYIVPHILRDYRITSLEPGVVKIIDSDGNLVDTHVMNSATKATPADVSVGTLAGGGTATSPSASVRFEGTMPFYLRVNDNDSNEYPVLGYRRRETSQYQNSTTIDGDKIRTGIIQSNNLTASLGSSINLNLGTIELGGTSDPNFKVDEQGLVFAANFAERFASVNDDNSGSFLRPISTGAGGTDKKNLVFDGSLGGKIIMNMEISTSGAFIIDGLELPITGSSLSLGKAGAKIYIATDGIQYDDGSVNSGYNQTYQSNAVQRQPPGL